MQQPNTGSVSPGPARSDTEPVLPLDMHVNNAHACGWPPLISTSGTTDEDESLLVENIYLCMIQIPSVLGHRQSTQQLAPGSSDLAAAPCRDRNTHRQANACCWLLLDPLFSPVSAGSRCSLCSDEILGLSACHRSSAHLCIWASSATQYKCHSIILPLDPSNFAFCFQ